MTLIHETEPARKEARECAYNLSRNKERPELFCAVPEDRPVPSVIVAEAWAFERIFRTHDVAPPGFHERGARVGVRYNGFYLFQATAPISPSTQSTVQHPESA